MNIRPVLWGIFLSLFLGGLGLPLPENPILVGGGYAIYQRISPPLVSIVLWYLAILSGDFLLFATCRWFFRRPSFSRLINRCIGESRLERYENGFRNWGGWTLFLARFTFGILALAYVAAGAVGYPWARFLVVDGFSVAIQVLLFAGLGYYTGHRLGWAEVASEKIVFVITIGALLTLFTWELAALIRRIMERKI